MMFVGGEALIYVMEYLRIYASMVGDSFRRSNIADIGRYGGLTWKY